MLDKKELIDYLAISMKTLGYKKTRNNWKKQSEDLTIVITIQSSQYDTNTFYVCFGVAIDAISPCAPTSTHMCDIKSRLDGDVFPNYKSILAAIKLWEEKYGTLSRLRKAAIAGRLPIQSSLKASSYLTSF